MVNVHVLTPFSRQENFHALAEMLLPQGIRWHVVCHQGPLPAEHDGATAYLAVPPTGYDPCYWKLNWWIRSQADSGQIVNDDWYHFLPDDEGIPRGYYQTVREQPAGVDVLFTSSLRGRAIPGDAKHKHPTHTFLATPENCRHGMALSQIHVRGRVLRELLFQNVAWSDGHMAEYLKQEHDGRIAFEPWLFVLFNWFEQGRW